MSTGLAQRSAIGAVPVSYKSGAGVAGFARFTMFAVVLASAVTLAALVVDYRALLRVLEVGLPPEIELFEAANDRFVLTTLVAAGASIIMGIALIVWTRRLYRNLPALGVRDLRFSPGWAAGGWLVPILSWWRPKQVLNDVWRGCEFDGPGLPETSWRGRSVPRWLDAWWAILVLATVAGSTWIVSEVGTASSRWVITRALAIVLLMATALLGTVVVRRLTDHQEAAAWFRFGASPRFGSELRDRAVVAGVVITAVVVGLAGYLTWVNPGASTDVGSAVTGESLHYFGYGVGFDYPRDLKAVETPVIGSVITEDVGAVFAYSSDQSDYAAVAWVVALGRYRESQLWELLDGGVSGMEGSGATVTQGRRSAFLLRGQTVVTLQFTGAGGGETFEGIMAATNCTASDRAVSVFSLSDGPFVDTKATFDQVLDSLSC